jgi:hypothetical protein
MIRTRNQLTTPSQERSPSQISIIRRVASDRLIKQIGEQKARTEKGIATAVEKEDELAEVGGGIV